MSRVDVYMEDFISNCQGGPKEMCQMLRQRFMGINTVFRTNEATDGLLKEPIYLKKLGQGGRSLVH